MAADETPDEPLLVGRDAEMAELGRVLDDARPVVLAVSAEAGAGQTTLLRTFCARAARRGWTVVWADPTAGAGVTQATTVTSFADELRHAVDAPIEPRARSTDRLGSALARLMPTLRSTVDAVDRGDRLGLRAVLARQDPLVGELAHRAPLLLVIDDFRPAPAFARWFAGRFSVDVVHANAALVVIVAVRPVVVDALDAAGDRITVMSLGPLDAAEVSRHFDSLAGHIRPPLTERELECYATAASREPALLADLTHVLCLEEAAPSTSGAGDG